LWCACLLGCADAAVQQPWAQAIDHAPRHQQARQPLGFTR
jgi:hypothetical protein